MHSYQRQETFVVTVFGYILLYKHAFFLQKCGKCVSGATSSSPLGTLAGEHVDWTDLNPDQVPGIAEILE